MDVVDQIKQSPERILSKKYNRYVWMVPSERRMREVLRHEIAEPIFLKSEVDLIKKEKSDTAMVLLLAMKDAFPGAILRRLG